MPDPDDTADRRTLERLALAGWSRAAAVRVVSVTVVGRRAKVALLVNGGYEYWMYFLRDERGWSETVDGNGPTDGWHEPSTVRWGDRS